MTSLTLYGTNVASTTKSTANQLAIATGSATSSQITMLLGTALGYSEMFSQGSSAAWAAAAGLSAPTGHGFFLENATQSLIGQQILAGTWTPNVHAKVSVGTATVDFYIRLYVYDTVALTYTQIGSTMSLTGNALTTTSTLYTFAGTSQPVQNFGTNSRLYIDIWYNVTANSTGSSAATIGYAIATAGTVQGHANAIQTTTPGFQATPVLSTSPSSLSFSATQGGANPASQNSSLSETAGTATNWTSSISYGSGSGWLAISPTSGALAASGNQTVGFTCTTGSLTPATYTATVTFTATTGGNTATVSVSFVVSAAGASPSVSPTSLSFSGMVGGSNPASQNVTLTNTGSGSGSWSESISYGSGSGWLAVSPISGSLGSGSSTPVTFSCSLTGLSIGTYTATVTFTMGSNTATVTVTFSVTAFHITTYTILLANQDITQYVDQMSIVVDDTLGQGAGAGSSGATQGRASTIKFNCSLGPMSTAVGAGQALPAGGPWLVRQGEVKVYDSTGTIIFGGFATKYTDTTTSILGQTKQNFTTVEGIDYSTSLQRTLINEVFTGQTDIQIIQYVVQKYVGWVSLAYLPTTPAYMFSTKNFRNQTVEQVLQTIAGITGYLIFVDYNKFLHYISPTTASSAPFNLSSRPNFVNTFPHAVAEYLVDDNSAINRVFFYGGTKTSNDFWQDISALANGSNLTFPLAYYPSPMSDGKYHLKVNGVDGTIATSTTSGAAGQFVSQGGSATVLIDPGSRAITFDTGHAPASGTSLLAGYRYAFPLSLVITDENSHSYFGSPYLDGSIDDNTIYDLMTGIQRCKVLLAQQSFGLVTLKLDIYNKPGVQSGMIINVFNQLRGINGNFLVQEVQIEPYGGGNFVYHLTLGAWNWNLIDFLMKLPTLATFQDNTTETQETVTIEQILSNVRVHDAWTSKTSTPPYYARATAVGDGHDAFPGFATITS